MIIITLDMKMYLVDIKLSLIKMVFSFLVEAIQGMCVF